jgi:hypothetical protein
MALKAALGGLPALLQRGFPSGFQSGFMWNHRFTPDPSLPFLSHEDSSRRIAVFNHLSNIIVLDKIAEICLGDTMIHFT